MTESELDTLLKLATRVWAEDDATTRDPDHETVEAAFKRLTRQDFVRAETPDKLDCGDCVWYMVAVRHDAMRYLIADSYPGNCAIYAISVIEAMP